MMLRRLEKLSREVQELRYQQKNAAKPAADTEPCIGQASPGETPPASQEVTTHNFDTELESFHLKDTSINKDVVVGAFKM